MSQLICLRSAQAEILLYACMYLCIYVGRADIEEALLRRLRYYWACFSVGSFSALLVSVSSVCACACLMSSTPFVSVSVSVSVSVCCVMLLEECVVCVHVWSRRVKDVLVAC